MVPISLQSLTSQTSPLLQGSLLEPPGELRTDAGRSELNPPAPAALKTREVRDVYEELPPIRKTPREDCLPDAMALLLAWRWCRHQVRTELDCAATLFESAESIALKRRQKRLHLRKRIWDA